MYHDSMNFKLHTGNIEWGIGGGCHDLKCGRNRSVILRLNRTLQLILMLIIAPLRRPG